MKKNKISRKILFMAGLCFLFAYGIWSWTEKQIQFHMGQINSGLEQVAQVQTKSNQVIRNQSGQLLWQDIDIGEAVYIGNSIQTEKQSSTEIIMNDGEKILIGPESLVRFSRSEDKISLQLVEGKMEIKTDEVAVQEIMRIEPKKSKKLVIKTPRGQLHINNANVKLKADKNNENNFKVDVVAGTPELVTAEKEKEVLQVTTNENEKIDVFKVDQPSASEISIQEKLAAEAELQQRLIENNALNNNATLNDLDNLSAEYVEVSPQSTQTIVSGVNPDTGLIDRKPARATLTAPKVKNIKVKEIE